MGVPREMDFIPPVHCKSRTPLGFTNVYFPQAREKAKRTPVVLSTGYSRTAMVKQYEPHNFHFINDKGWQLLLCAHHQCFWKSCGWLRRTGGYAQVTYAEVKTEEANNRNK